MAFDFANLADVAAAKGQLRSVADDSAFAWLKPVIETSLADYVRGRLRDEPPDTDRYSAFAVEDNVSVANDMVNRCLTRRGQIYDLEANALLTAIGYQQEQALANSEARLARLRAEADLAVSQRSMTAEIERCLGEQVSVRAGALRARIALHNLAGSSLNYGEQIAFMREIYADNIRNLLERIDAIRRGLQACYGIGVTSLPELPEAGQQADDLDRIVWWLRGVIMAVEMVERAQTVSTLYLPLFRMQGMAAADAQATWNTFLQNGYVQAEVTEDILLSHGIGGLARGAPMRVVGVNAALLLGRAEYMQATGQPDDIRANAEVENRLIACRSFGFPCTVIGPEQNEGWEQARLPASLVHLIANESAAAQLQPLDPGPLRNHSPYGAWSVQVGPRAVQGLWHPNTAEMSLQVALRNFPPGSVDVVLCLSLASSPFLAAP
jgi:hypothetical protein